MLLDSNIIIYAAQLENEPLRQFIQHNVPAVSVISYVEVLGYHRLSDEDRHFFEDFFEATEILPLTNGITTYAVRLR
ncbi:MAG: hypothetical protein VKJ46_02645, partial [Leptolyngbyaceae bacterium]|nr:hypothetical protein [Leptolyngbyaceae bacterium]